MDIAKVSYTSEFVNDMKEYSKTLKNLTPEEARQKLIRIGVLDSNGKPNDKICKNNYAGDNGQNKKASHS